MAVLGAQIVITMVFASLLSKLGPYFSLARWMLVSTGLVRYLHPDNYELKQLANIPNKPVHNGSGKRGKKNGTKVNNENEIETFMVPRNLDIQLETTHVTFGDVVQLRFFTEYQWLVDFSVCSVLVYLVTEIYVFYFPTKAATEVNLSLVWCFLVAGFAYRLLCSVNSLYFRGEESGERSLVVVMGFVYLLLAMMILVVDEDTLETGLDEAYASFNQSAAQFLQDNTGLDSSGPASKLVLKFFLALWCASIGALLTFPGIRLAKMQWDVLQYAEGGGFVNVLIHISFISPLLVATLWVKPLGREYLTERIFKGMEKPFMTSCQFESLRLYLLLGIVLFRLALMPKYLQSYLNVAYHKLEEIKQEVGRISNIELQQTITRVFYYLCVVTLQYVAPMILLFYMTLLYKTLGRGSWTGLWSQESHCTENITDDLSQQKMTDFDEAAKAVGENFSLAWQSVKQVFTPAVYRGILGFSTWWCCLIWFFSSAIGIAYQSYFAKV